VFFRKEIGPSFLLQQRPGSITTPIRRPLNFHTARGGDLRAVVSRETGLPVGIFRLTNETGQEIFDCQILESYGLQLGCTVCLETWDGWNELIPAAVSGFAKQVDFKPTVDCSLVLRVGLIFFPMSFGRTCNHLFYLVVDLIFWVTNLHF